MTDLLWIFSRLDWGDVVLDIPLVALAVFLLLYLVRTTQAVPLLRGVILLIAIIGLLSAVFELRAFSWVLLKAPPALLVSIPVIFQPELRRALERSRSSSMSPTRSSPGQNSFGWAEASSTPRTSAAAASSRAGGDQLLSQRLVDCVAAGLVEAQDGQARATLHAQAGRHVPASLADAGGLT